MRDTSGQISYWELQDFIQKYFEECVEESDDEVDVIKENIISNVKTILGY
tara:strand:- start:2192 stop:2341 length:150 start_codon:yes stop_codon:yes gene_type:complete